MTAGKVVRMWWRAYHSPQPAIIAIHLVLLTLGLAGLVLALRRREAVALAFAAIVLWCTIDNAILVAESRHNMPLMPGLVAIGGGALVHALVARPRARAPTTAEQPATGDARG